MSAVLAASREVLDDLRPLKSYEIPDFPWALLTGFFLVLVVGTVLWFGKRRRRSTVANPVVWTQSMPGTARTLRGRLEALLHAPRQTQAQVLQICEQLGDIVRDLARQRHGVPGRRLTTSELLERLENQAVPGDELRAYRILLETCDRVKFSGERISADVVANRLTLAGKLLDGLDRPEESA